MLITCCPLIGAPQTGAVHRVAALSHFVRDRAVSALIAPIFAYTENPAKLYQSDHFIHCRILNIFAL
jgi:hypothetical protein